MSNDMFILIIRPELDEMRVSLHETLEEAEGKACAWFDEVYDWDGSDMAVLREMESDTEFTKDYGDYAVDIYVINRSQTLEKID